MRLTTPYFGNVSAPK